MADIVQILFLRQAQITCGLKNIIHNAVCWEDDLAPDQREALDMFCIAAARILNGDPNVPENWRDIESFARLVANRLEEKPDG